MHGKIVGHEPKQVYYLEGKRVTKAEFFRAFPPVEEHSADALIGWKPLESIALAVHPRQVAQAVGSARAKGVPTEFTPEGSPIFTSRSHRRAYLRAYHVHDNNGGYGDG